MCPQIIPEYRPYHIGVTPFLHKVFYGKWWEVDEEETVKVIKDVTVS